MKHPKPAKSEGGPMRAASLLEERRRSQRVMLRMPVVLHLTGRPQPINGMTIAVSESGAMVVVPEPLPAATKLTLENPATKTRVGASVTRAAQVTPEGALVPLEFAEKSPAFWNIVFPPPAP